MEGEVITISTGKYVRAGVDGGQISSGKDILDLFSTCFEAGADKLLIEEAALDPAFFDLSSGLAGDVLLKLSNYKVQTAVVANLKAIKSARFQELIQESNRSRQINFFESLPAAEKWLLSG